MFTSCFSDFLTKLSKLDFELLVYESKLPRISILQDIVFEKKNAIFISITAAENMQTLATITQLVK